jgi:hypothetical protein
VRVIDGACSGFTDWKLAFSARPPPYFACYRAWGGGWSILWRSSAPDRWEWFIRKNFEFNTESPPELRAISESANLSISSGFSRAASIRVESAVVALMNVRCWGKGRRHLLSWSFSALDPERTLGRSVVSLSQAVISIKFHGNPSANGGRGNYSRTAG